MTDKRRLLRTVTAGIFALAAAVGIVMHGEAGGTFSSFGWRDIALICPLGSLEALLASKTLIPAALASFLVFFLVTALLGRVFCGWVCPVPLTRRLAGRESAEETVPAKEIVSSCSAAAAQTSVIHVIGHDGKPVSAPKAAAKSGKAAASFFGKKKDVTRAAPYAVLAGALASAAVFGFPVFCLICPVGLFFAIIIGIWHLVGMNDPSMTLLLFIVLFALEVLVFRRWCSTFCPIGALFSIFAGVNRFFRPSISKSACLQGQGADCSRCTAACDEGIDLHKAKLTDYMRCTRCGECAGACPSGAIRFPFFGKNEARTSEFPQRKEPPARAASERTADFAPISGAFTKEEAMAQAARCVQCGECMDHCPMHNPIPEVMRRIAEGKFRAAADLITGPGAMPELTCRLCPHEKLCESGCSLAGIGGAVPVGSLMQFAADTALASGWRPRARASAAKLTAAAVGAGPSGMAFADAMQRNGVKVTLFDSASEIGGLLSSEIPGYKFPKELLHRRAEFLAKNGAELKLGIKPLSAADVHELRKSFSAVYVAAGAAVPRALEVSGAEADGVMLAPEFLKAVTDGTFSSEKKSLAGKTVLVLGGGDTAADCARSAVRLGAAKALIAYRKERALMKAGLSETRAAEEEGVQYLFNAVPQEVLSENGKAAAVRFADGRTEKADLVIAAFGFVSEEPKWAEELAELEAAETAPLGLLLMGGDLSRGASLVSQAVSDGRAAAESVISQLTAGRKGKK